MLSQHEAFSGTAMILKYVTISFPTISWLAVLLNFIEALGINHVGR
jgi:hypothetical protein